MPTEPQPVTLAQVVRRAVEVCDPQDTDADLGDVLVRFEDADELSDDPDDILHLAARAEWKGHPPRVVADWLAERGIEV